MVVSPIGTWISVRIIEPMRWTCDRQPLTTEFDCGPSTASISTRRSSLGTRPIASRCAVPSKPFGSVGHAPERRPMTHDESGEGRDLNMPNNPQAPGAKWPSSVTESSPAARVDVLIVDDDDGLRSTWADIIGSSGFSVAVAEDGDIALHILSQISVGLVLLDLRMPRRDGFSVLESLTVPQLVVLVSAQSLDEAALARVESKIVTFLEKPDSPRTTPRYRRRHTQRAPGGRQLRPLM